MRLLKISKKKNIPDELPELITDKIEKNLKEIKTVSQQEESKPVEKIETKIEKQPEIKTEVKKEDTKPVEKIEIKKPKLTEDKGFFAELDNYLNKEIKNLHQLENWCNSKFLSRDIVSDMKNYWEKQKNNSVIQILGKGFQEKIAEKTTKLQLLEKEWQTVYFDLIEKEEQIRTEERELKKALAEFLEFCKRKEEDISKAMNKFFEIEKDDSDRTIRIL